jgi:hypothetical protein
MGSIDLDAPNGEASRTARPIAAAPQTRTGMRKEIPARAARPPSRCRYRAPSHSRPAAQERRHAVSRAYTLDGREHHPIHRADNMLMLRRVPVRRASLRPLLPLLPLPTPICPSRLSCSPASSSAPSPSPSLSPGAPTSVRGMKRERRMCDGGGSSGRRRRASTLRPRTAERMQNASGLRDEVASRRHRRNRESAKETNQKRRNREGARDVNNSQSMKKKEKGM